MKKVNLPIKILALIIILLLAEFRVGSAQTFRHNQVWLDVTSTFQLSKNLKANLEIGYRAEPSEKLSQTYFRSMLFYSPQEQIKMSIWIAQYNSRYSDRNTSELRTSEFIYITWPKVQGFKFVHRFGLDQRMFYAKGYALNKYVHRSRYRFAIHSSKFSLFNSQPKFYIKTSFEVLRNMKQNETQVWVDHDWITLNLGYTVSKRLCMEGHVLLIHSIEPNKLEFKGEISVLRLRLKYKFL